MIRFFSSLHWFCVILFLPRNQNLQRKIWICFFIAFHLLICINMISAHGRSSMTKPAWGIRQNVHACLHQPDCSSRLIFHDGALAGYPPKCWCVQRNNGCISIATCSLFNQLLFLPLDVSEPLLSKFLTMVFSHARPAQPLVDPLHHCLCFCTWWNFSANCMARYERLQRLSFPWIPESNRDYDLAASNSIFCLLSLCSKRAKAATETSST